MQDGGAPRSITTLIRRGQFARLFWAGAVSSMGDWVSLFASIALGNALAGTVGISVPLVARFLPAVFVGAAAGVVAYRFDAKRVMVVSDIARGLLAATLVFVGTLQALFVVTLLIEVFSLVRQPAREAAMGRVVERNELMNANSVSVFITYGTIPLAGALWTGLAAISEQLLDASPWQVAYAFDAVTFALSAAIMATMVVPSGPAGIARKMGSWGVRGALDDFQRGVRYVLGNPVIRIPVLSVVWALVGAAPIFVLGEPFSQQILGLGSTGFGVLATAIGFGTALGVLAARALDSSKLELALGFAIALIVAGMGVIGVAFSDNLGTAGTGAFTAGFGTGAAYVLAFTTIHATVSDELRGRTFATLFMLARAGMVVSLAAAPLLATVLDGIVGGELAEGTRLTFFISGSVVVTAGIAAAVGWARHRVETA